MVGLFIALNHRHPQTREKGEPASMTHIASSRHHACSISPVMQAPTAGCWLLGGSGDLNHIQHENCAKSPLTNSSQKTSSFLFCAQTSRRAWAGGPPSSRPS